jgi:hypothetical protein
MTPKTAVLTRTSAGVAMRCRLRVQRVTERVALRTRLHDGRLQLLHEIDGHREVALAVRRCGHADRDPAEDQEQEYEVHVQYAQEVCQPITPRQR